MVAIFLCAWLEMIRVNEGHKSLKSVYVWKKTPAKNRKRDNNVGEIYSQQENPSKRHFNHLTSLYV